MQNDTLLKVAQFMCLFAKLVLMLKTFSLLYIHNTFGKYAKSSDIL